MTALALRDRSALPVRQAALEAVGQLYSLDKRSEALAIYYWCLGNIRYVEDIAGIETIQSPVVTLTNRQGDCDCISTLILAMCLSINVPVQLVKVGMTPESYSHVLVRALPYGPSGIAILLDTVATITGPGVMKKMRNNVKLSKFYPILSEATVNGFEATMGRLVEFN